jgi:choline-sulfatase
MAARRASNRPNILLVMFDQMSALSLPCYGHPIVKAPYLSALADSGVVFEQAYCNAPLCSPSRHSMMTGCLPSRIGAFDNAAELQSGTPTFVHYLRAAGYRTCLSGKMDFTGADQLHGYEERLTTDLSPSDFGWTPNWDEPKRLYDWFHSLQSVTEAGACDHSQTMTYDEDATNQARRWLYEAAQAEDRRPFLLTVSYMHPHDPYLGPRPFWDGYRADDIDMPAVPWPRLSKREPAARRLYALYDRGEHQLAESHIRAARRAYYAMIDYVDAQLGRVLETLKETGLADNTVVIATSDHGDMLGERGLWYKMTFFERAVRVPLLLNAPRQIEPRRVTEPVSLVDILPTLMGIATHKVEFEPILPLDGTSLLPVAKGEMLATGVVHAEYMAEGTDQPMFMIRRGRLKYVSCPGDPPLMFDVGSDPLEQRNLATTRAVGKHARGFAAEVSRKWDAATLRQTVIESQRARRFVHQALTTGRVHPWDFAPVSDPALQYYRNYGRSDPERHLRFPPPENSPPRKRAPGKRR